MGSTGMLAVRLHPVLQPSGPRGRGRIRAATPILAVALVLGFAPPGVRPAAGQHPIPLDEVVLDADQDRVPDRLGDTVLVEGVVTSDPVILWNATALVGFQDGTGGILLVSRDTTVLQAVQRGDSIRTRGTVGQDAGAELLMVERVDRLGRGDMPEPRNVLAAELDDERLAGQLVRVTGVLRRVPSEFGWARVVLEDRSGSIPVYLDPGWLTERGLAERLRAGTEVEVVGLAAQFTSAVPPAGGYYLLPRDARDFRFPRTPPYAAMIWVTMVVALAALGWWRRVAARRARRLEALSLELEASRNELRERQARLQSLVENAADTISILDAHGFILYQSPSVRRMLAWEPEDLVDRNALRFVHPEDRRAAFDFLTTLAADESASREIELRVRTKQGKWRRLEVLGSNRLHDPAVQGIVCNTRDVTDHRALQERVRQADRMEVVGRLAGGIAHDFNNLLTALRGHAQMALDAMAAGAEGRPDVEEVVRSADRAASLTRQLLAFSRQQVMKPRVVVPSRIVRDMLPMIRRLIGENIRLVTRFQERTPSIRVDPAQFEQVLMNLVVNARDAMPEGGRLGLELAEETLPGGRDRDGGAIDSGEYVRLTVVDTGVGMSPAVLKRIFEPFFTTKEQGRGTGLGLATLYGIVKQSGGHITARSKPGQGTRLDVYFPRVDGLPEHAAPARAAAVTRSDGQRRVVLLVEDEAAVRKLARRVLEKADYHVLEAETPAVALQLAEEHAGRVDLLLTDVIMPVMTGPQLAARLREAHLEVPTLFTSGYTDDEVVRHGVVAGETAFLEKPFTPQALLEAVRSVLESRPVSA